MRNGSVRVGAVVALFACAALCIAQSTPVSDKFIISAKAGGVNAVFGDVTVEREDGRTGRLLKGDEVQIGERVEFVNQPFCMYPTQCMLADGELASVVTDCQTALNIDPRSASKIDPSGVASLCR